MAEKSGWEIKIADDLSQDDSENACKFLLSFRTAEDEPIWSPEYFRWKLKENLAGEGFLTLAISDKEVVGTVSVTPKHVWYKGSIVDAAESGDTYTHPDFQRQGIFTTVVDATRKRAQDAGHSLVYGTPNDQSRPGYEKNLDFLTHPTFSLKVPTYVSKLPNLVEKNSPRIFGQAMSKLVELFLYVLRKCWLLLGKSAGISVKEVDSVGPEYDELWRKYREHNDFLLVRDGEHINYRFFKHPLAKYQFYEARRNGELCGYLVTRRQEIRGKYHCMIADWFYNFRSPLILLSLLNTGLEKSLSCGIRECCAWVTQSHPDKWLFVLSGFVLLGQAPIIFHKNEIGRQILSRKDKWHFTIADSDNV